MKNIKGQRVEGFIYRILKERIDQVKNDYLIYP